MQSLGKCDKHFVFEKIIATISLTFMKLLIYIVLKCEYVKKKFNKEITERKNLYNKLLDLRGKLLAAFFYALRKD